jgi:phosphatidylglycerol lysyltransferase
VEVGYRVIEFSGVSFEVWRRLSTATSMWSLLPRQRRGKLPRNGPSAEFMTLTKKTFSVRRLLPIALSALIVALAWRFLQHGGVHQLDVADVLGALHEIPLSGAIIGASLAILLYGALALCEAIIAGVVAGPVTPRRAALGILASSIGHVLGLGAVSGGAIRYRLYSAVGMRPLDIGKMILLAAIPYPAGLGILLAASLLIQTEAAAPLLHSTPALVRGIGLALVALHLGYLTLVLRHRGPIHFGALSVPLPPPRLTAIQYLVGVLEVTCGAGILYVLLPPGTDLPFTVYMGVYVVSILAGLASGLPAGLGVFDVAMVALLPNLHPAQVTAVVIVYRGLLEVGPVLIALTAFAAYEIWWRLPAQRARAAAVEADQRDLD